MAIERLSFGTAANNDGEFIRTAFPKLDSNDAYLEGLISAHETRIDDLETDVTAGVPSGTSGYALIGNGVGNATTFQGFTQAGTGAVTRTWQEKMRDAISVTDFGAVQDSSTDCTTAFNNALATGRDVYVPDDGAGYYRVTGTLTPVSGAALIGAASRPEIRLDSASVALLFNLDSLDGVTISSLTLNGNKATTPSNEFISLNNATNCEISRNTITNPPEVATGIGSILISGTSTGNRIAYNKITDCEGTAIGLSGASVSQNEIVGNEITDAVYFGIRLGEGAHDNLIQNNKTTSNGLELIGITSDCHGNRVIGNHAEGCGDNGISLSGYNNICTGNKCISNDGAGIWSWGSFNVIVGNHCLNNNQQNAGTPWSGIGISANYGGAGQYNTVVGNLCDDDQASPTQWNGVRISGNSYTEWAAAQAVTSGSTYRYYGLNIYVAASSGTTGATPPTHTSGTVSDGAVNWTYKRSFLTTATSGYNTVSDNSVPRYQSAAYYDVGTYATNKINDRSFGNFGSLGYAVFGSLGGEPMSWTSAKSVSIKETGNAGLAIQSGATSLGRVSFGDTALAGFVEYDHATDLLSVATGNGTKRTIWSASAFYASTTLAVSLGGSANVWNGAYIGNAGLFLHDTDASHFMKVVAGSNMTADRTLTVTTGDANRTLDISAGSVTISSAGAALIDDADAAAQRTTLGLVIGTDVQAYDADLTTWAGITPGTGVASALAVNVGTAGAFVANGGALGTPSSGTLTNCTGLPISTGVSGLASGIATFLATPSSANLAAAVTDETGSGALVFGTSPTLTTGVNLSSGFVFNWNSSDALLTHSADTLTFSGDSIAFGVNVEGSVRARSGYGTGAFTLGADVNATTLTTSVRKLGRITAPSYNTSQANTLLLGADNDGTNNNVFFGGTPGASNVAATLISFVTTASIGTTGGTLRATIDGNGNFTVGSAALSTSATDGFLYVPTCAGTPTGTPTTKTGCAPVVVNTTNNKLYFYSGGAWRDAGP